MAKERRLKRYQDKGTKTKVPRNRNKKGHSKIRKGEECTKTNQQMDAKQNNIQIKYGNQINRKADRINDMKKELHGLEERPEANFLLELLQATFKKAQNLKMPGHNGIHGFWLEKNLHPSMTD